MKNISQALQHRFAQKNMAKLSIGAFLVHQSKSYVTFPQELRGNIRNNILFLQVDYREDKAGLFIKKGTILLELNKKLLDLGYVYVIKEIRFR